jgi:hypothetical protein
MQAAIAASSHPLYRERYQRTKRFSGRRHFSSGCLISP